MTKIYCFISGNSGSFFRESALDQLTMLHTACALTEKGKWIAGAVSQESDTALERVAEMARRKAPDMLSGPSECVVVHEEFDLVPEVMRALELALVNMP